MNFVKRFFKKLSAPTQLTCPRCEGKGHVDEADIIRLHRQGVWGTGTCAYCNGTGNVDETMFSKVPVDAAHLVLGLTDEERDAIINGPKVVEPSLDEKLNGCPIPEQNRLWLEDTFLVLLDFFGKDNTLQRKVLLPQYTDFPIKYDNQQESLYETMKIVATQMEVPYEKIRLGLYDENGDQGSSGGQHERGLFTSTGKINGSAGLYWGEGEDGQYDVWLNRAKLTSPENLVAILAHEIAHIKLLGEDRIEENNEHATDLTTVFFGLGIFNANAALQTFSGYRSWGYTSLGYLTQPQWGYALALFAYIRGEQSPAWIKHLLPNVKKDFLDSQRFIDKNRELVFNGAW